MNEPAENYISIDLKTQMYRQATRVWSVTVAVVFAWLLLIVLPPILGANGFEGFSAPVYNFFGFICHQIDDRSFHIVSHKLAVCSRCFGVYLGLLAGLVVYPLWRKLDDIEPLPRKWLVLSIIPLGIDWSLTFLNIWENTFASRFVTGIILGAACATYIMPALVEIVRNFSRPRRSVV